MEVAAETGIREIVERISTPMLLGYDVLDLKRRKDMDLGKMAVFTLPAGTLPDFPLRRLVHPWNLAGGLALERLTSLQVK